MNKKLIIKYAPGTDIKAEKIEVDREDVLKTVNTICYGYDSVYTKRIASI